MSKRRNVVSSGRHLAIRYQVNGRRVYESLPAGSTNADAQALLARRLQEIRTGSAIAPSSATVGAFLAEWLRTSRAQDNTLRVYSYAVRHLSEALGSVPLQRLTVAHIEQAKNIMQEGSNGVATRDPAGIGHESPGGLHPGQRRGTDMRRRQRNAGSLQGHSDHDGVWRSRGRAQGSRQSTGTRPGLSPKTINGTLDVGRTAFAWGQKMGLVSSNPFALVDRLALAESTKRSLTPEEAQRLLAELRNSNNQHDLMLAFMLVTLRRYCEAAGLRKVDVDRERKQYAVEQVWLANLHKFKRPDGQKNKRATYELMDTAAAILRQAEMAQTTQRHECELFGWPWQDSGLVFTADLGGPVPHSSLRQTLRFACLRAGIEPIAPHELRHTGASLLVASGADQWQLMAAGGWKSLAVIQRTYAHLFPARTRDALEGLERLLTRKGA